MKNQKLLKVANVRERMDAHYRGEISYSRAVELLNEDANKALHIAGVGTRLFGVYSPDDNLLSVHLSAEGAHKNKEAFEDNYKIYGYYVDYVMLQP